MSSVPTAAASSSQKRNPEIFGFIDGASRGNPGESACAFVLCNRQGELLFQCARRIGRATNNQAEYQALLGLLAKVIELGINEVTVFSDSQLLVRQISGAYRVQSPQLKPLYREVLNQVKKLTDFNIYHIPREQNTLADQLASQVLSTHLKLKPVFEQAERGNI
ncbi:MAG: ribonuclease [Candidatus Atribacteria bacterium]|nr:ribonuclease [Candidatus Atribacteria bacterium]